MSVFCTKLDALQLTFSSHKGFDRPMVDDLFLHTKVQCAHTAVTIHHTGLFEASTTRDNLVIKPH
ncbi:hypothetical protein AF72_09575 [Xylella taiwanensis]|uniref:Uncharacterized protein n=1 Tax=Xylella taiwanensis TaxID=1444770 RepID=Z9JHN5_9GAMM|nr:hypothetical protein AB672_00505 [Xylella taiwanensis]EWS77684.1 hypothetical protein AF72_09575 [Xylella taiwanensis]